METIEHIGTSLKDYLKYPLIELGSMTITIYSLLYFLIGLFLLFFLSNRFKRILINHILIRYTPELGVMLITNGDRGAGNRGGATQDTEVLLFLVP